MSSPNTQNKYVNHEQYVDLKNKAVSAVKLLADKLVEVRVDNDLNLKKVSFLEERLEKEKNTKSIAIIADDDTDLAQILARELERGLGDFEQSLLEKTNKSLDIYKQKY